MDPEFGPHHMAQLPATLSGLNMMMREVGPCLGFRGQSTGYCPSSPRFQCHTISSREERRRSTELSLEDTQGSRMRRKKEVRSLRKVSATRSPSDTSEDGSVLSFLTPFSVPAQEHAHQMHLAGDGYCFQVCLLKSSLITQQDGFHSQQLYLNLTLDSWLWINIQRVFWTPKRKDGMHH